MKALLVTILIASASLTQAYDSFADYRSFRIEEKTQERLPASEVEVDEDENKEVDKTERAPASHIQEVDSHPIGYWEIR